MDQDDDYPQELLDRMIALDDADEREIESFYVFPDWFPEPSKLAYQVLLSNLLQHFRRRWPKDFNPSLLRSWINHAMEFYAKKPEASDFNKAKFPTDFESLELPLIFELARYEYGANLPMVDGLAFISNKSMAGGYKREVGYRNSPKFSDKTDFQRLFIDRQESIKSIADIDNFPELKAYRKFAKDKTLRAWIAEVAPGHLKAGRPRKNNNI